MFRFHSEQVLYPEELLSDYKNLQLYCQTTYYLHVTMIIPFIINLSILLNMSFYLL